MAAAKGADGPMTRTESSDARSCDRRGHDLGGVGNIGSVAHHLRNRAVGTALVEISNTAVRAVREINTVRRIAGDGW